MHQPPMTKPVVALWAETAFTAAKLSEQIATEQSFLSNKLSSLAQVSKAYAWNTEV